MTQLSWVTVAQLALNAGFRGNDLVIATAITQPESGRNPNSRYVTSREDSRGLWQINTYAHHEFDKNRLYDPQYNANAAHVVYRNAGYRFGPWTTYTTGKYRAFMGDAQNAVDHLGSVGQPVGGGEAPAPVQGTGPGEAPAPLDQASWDMSQGVAAQGQHWNRIVQRAYDFASVIDGI